jgi:hypothetical protein
MDYPNLAKPELKTVLEFEKIEIRNNYKTYRNSRLQP